MVDDESTADDNRGLSPNQAGQLTGADANGILTLNISKQEHTAEFKTTMQPGDNYRIAASFDKNYLMQLINDDTQGSSNMEKQLIVDGKQNHSNLFMSRISDSHQYVSAPLTVWRFLHIERDSMGVITKNSISGDITNVQPQGEFSYVKTNITFTEINSMNRFKGGELHNNGQIFEIDSHDNGVYISIKVFNNGINPPNSTPIPPIIGPVTLYDDDDFNSDDTHKKDGDENEDIAMPDIALVQANDDKVCTDGSCNMFAQAYVRPIYDVGDNNTSVKVFVNTPGPRNGVTEAQELLATYDFDQSATKDSDTFWTVYLLGAYQMQEKEDCDGDLDFCTLGIVDKLNGDGASIFLEVANEFGPNRGSRTTVHELGHLFNGKHSHNGIMCGPLEFPTCNVFFNFDVMSLEEIRKIPHP